MSSDLGERPAVSLPPSTALPPDGSAPPPASEGRLGSVFWASVALSATFVIWGVFFTKNLSDVTNASLNWVTATFGWSYLLVTLALVVFLVFLAFSPAGAMRLGKDTDRPEFSTITWFAMILSAVMGIGLVSYGVAEPISHFATPPHGLAQPGTPEAAVRAMQYSYFDWGLQAWAIFAVFGLAMAYSTFRKGRRTLVSQLFVPLIGERRANGLTGKVIDVLAVFSTLFGTTTSLGLGALQVNNGLFRVFGVPVSSVTQVVIIAAVTAIFTLSAVTGVSKGIKYLSQGSAGLAIALFVFMLVVGPTVFLANLYIESLGTWATDFFRMSLQGTAFGGLEWMQWWTYFMMAWWVSWGAFVGVFLARISRGRTVRGFISGVLVVPSVVFFTWFTVFGGSAIHVDMFQGGDIAKQTTADINSAFFAMLGYFPLSQVTSVIAIILVIMFFVSGADANTYVLGMMTSNGSLAPRRSILILWGVLTGVTAVVLMFAGGLSALQNTVIVTSLPFLLIIAGLSVAFYKDLHTDRQLSEAAAALTKSPSDSSPTV
ncbi:choline/carnitine/betaine transport [Quadrisphaera granulorum]|uniref:Choline/carnitine/betaine transport n=1 Tax=Quadrisphaera granulorum TaxID=317664 RepID=A0A316AW19_9ACTN|nr:BCCT family transporter [Quadrisphaera granulorum]PWJ54327.1 choline/carnitine/betaine transport [Quadrisphaera granulorum]SZE96099.1 choline/carnitine/betaine transport [Quadrisphaera granulorum]